MSYTTNSSITRQDLNKARFSFSINNFPEAQKIKKTGERIISETYSIMMSRFSITVCPSGDTEKDCKFVSVFLGNISNHKVIVDYSFTVGSKVNSAKSKVFELNKSWGWSQFIKIEEVGQNLEVTVDVALLKEDILDAPPGGMSLAEWQFKKKSQKKLEKKSQKKLEKKLDENQQKLELKLEQKLEQMLEKKLEQKLEKKLQQNLGIKLEQKLEDKLNQLDHKINLKFEDLKEDIKAPARAPECPICFEELRPPTRIIQCLKGHKLCEPCSQKPEIPCCPDGCRAGFMGRDFGMEAFILKQFQTRRQ